MVGIDTAVEYRQSFWEALEGLGQQRRYKVSWEHGEMVVRPLVGNGWSVGVIDEFKHAFVHFNISVAGGMQSSIVQKEGYYAPGIRPGTAEHIILNCVSEAGSSLRNDEMEDHSCRRRCEAVMAA
jgi:hypothetical protein